MKFGKNLQKVIDISDPAWAPYWLNYKYLKKLIKVLIPADEAAQAAEAADDSDSSSVDESSTQTGAKRAQQGGDDTVERASAKRPRQSTSTAVPAPQQQLNGRHNLVASSSRLGQNPGEVAFFKFLHAELKKVEFFFETATKEFQIREERVRRGIGIIKRLNQSAMEEKWRTGSKAMYSLYKELLLLETFAIMNYVGFSKVLKKHDKVTGYRTCTAYMESIVNKANFTYYPEVMSMISSCDRMYERISEALEQETKKLLTEDEQLFLGTLQRMNEEVLGGDKKNGASPRPSPKLQSVDTADSEAVEDLRELLSEDASNMPNDDDESQGADRKELAQE